ncbi:hypothetical protein JCM10212_001105 [Sporobolomyces blumeae]
MFSSITSALGWATTSSSSSPAPPPEPARSGVSVPSIVAEPDTTSVAFPSLNSQQRSKPPSTRPPVPSFSLDSPTRSTSDNDTEDDEDAEDRSDDEGEGLPRIEASLAPPTRTTQVLKAPKGRVRVEKGFSQLDWAKLNRSGDVDLRGGVTQLRRITPSELAQHRTKDDCWQCYAGKVYNVGPFLRYHPGGQGEMMRGAGKDVLAHAWVNYESLLENCLVGFLGSED